MMRASIDRAWLALCAGRAPRDVALRIAVAVAGTGMLWACGFAFMLMEPRA